MDPDVPTHVSLPVTGWRLPVTGVRLPVTGWPLPKTGEVTWPHKERKLKTPSNTPIFKSYNHPDWSIGVNHVLFKGSTPSYNWSGGSKVPGFPGFPTQEQQDKARHELDTLMSHDPSARGAALLEFLDRFDCYLLINSLKEDPNACALKQLLTICKSDRALLSRPLKPNWCDDEFFAILRQQVDAWRDYTKACKQFTQNGLLDVKAFSIHFQTAPKRADEVAQVRAHISA